MRSIQEKVIENLVNRSIGGSFAFHPEIYQKGGATREPCDLVWSSNNCILLMCMTKKNSIKKMKKHNIGQLCGWMDEWKKGRPIEGSYLQRKHRIKYEDFKEKILVSVVGGEESCSAFEYDTKMKLNSKGIDCSICVTLDEKVLLYLAENGGSFVDMMNFIMKLKEKNAVLKGMDSLSLIENYRICEYERVGLDASRENLEVKYMMEMLRYARIKENVGVNGRKGAEEACEVFNDMAWSQVFTIARSIDQTCKVIEEVPRGEEGLRCVTSKLDMNPYFVTICCSAADAGSSGRLNRMMEIAFKEASFHSKKQHLHFGVIVTEVGRLPLIGMGGRPNGFISATELLTCQLNQGLSS